MQNLQDFDYDQPTCDTLTGIYVEVADSTAQTGTPATRQSDKLFGVTVTVDDEDTAQHHRSVVRLKEQTAKCLEVEHEKKERSE